MSLKSVLIWLAPKLEGKFMSDNPADGVAYTPKSELAAEAADKKQAPVHLVSASVAAPPPLKQPGLVARVEADIEDVFHGTSASVAVPAAPPSLTSLATAVASGVTKHAQLKAAYLAAKAAMLDNAKTTVAAQSQLTAATTANAAAVQSVVTDANAA